MSNTHSSPLRWAVAGLAVVGASLLGFWMGGRRVEPRTPRHSPARAHTADLAVASILREIRDILDGLRAPKREPGDPSASEQGRGVEGAARRGEAAAALPPPDLSRLVNLGQWHNDRALRQRWFLLERDEAAALFGVPDKVSIGQRGTEIWVYQIEGSEKQIGLVFHHEKLIDLIP